MTTIEELKNEANKLGYRLVKKPERVIMLPCPECGRRYPSPGEWYDMSNECYFKQCNNCGFRGGYSKTRIGAKKKWNEAVLEYRKENK